MSKTICTPEELYNLAKNYHDQSMEFDANSRDFKLYTSYSVKWFLDAFVAGYPKAAFALALYFKAGLGVVESDYMYKIMLGVAEKVQDERFNPKEHILDTSPNVVQTVYTLYNLFLEAQTDFANGIDATEIPTQLTKFNQTLHLTEGKTLLGYFLEADSSHLDNNETNLAGENNNCCSTCEIL